jgi:hypothetical protein
MMVIIQGVIAIRQASGVREEVIRRVCGAPPFDLVTEHERPPRAWRWEEDGRAAPEG